MRELCCKPKARCFKGLAILSGIYALGCALMLMFIPPVIEAHHKEKLADTDDKLHEMKVSTIVLLVVFAAISIINLLVCQVFTKREGRRESIINGNLIGHQNLYEEDDDYNGEGIVEK